MLCRHCSLCRPRGPPPEVQSASRRLVCGCVALPALAAGKSTLCLPSCPVPVYLLCIAEWQVASSSSPLHAAGILAYQLLTGRLPFSGEEGDEVSEVFQQRKVFDNRVRVSMGCSEQHFALPIAQAC